MADSSQGDAELTNMRIEIVGWPRVEARGAQYPTVMAGT